MPGLKVSISTEHCNMAESIQYNVLSYISPQQSSTDYSKVQEGREACGAEQQRAAHSSGRGREVIWVNYGNSTVTRHDRGGRVEAEWKAAE